MFPLMVTRPVFPLTKVNAPGLFEVGESVKFASIRDFVRLPNVIVGAAKLILLDAFTELAGSPLPPPPRRIAARNASQCNWDECDDTDDSLREEI